MATLPTDVDDSPNYTSDEHATHHNTLHGLWNKLTTKGDLLVATAAQVYARLGVGSDGQVLTADSAEAAGIKWAAPSGSGVVVAKNRRTAGNLTLNSTSWADVGLADLTIAAAAGDELKVELSSSANKGSAVGLVMDVATIVSGSPVNYLSTGGGASDFGNGSWYIGGAVAGADQRIAGGPRPYTVQAGDISGGNVTLRLRYRLTGAGTYTMFANATLPTDFWAINLG